MKKITSILYIQPNLYLNSNLVVSSMQTCLMYIKKNDLITKVNWKYMLYTRAIAAIYLFIFQIELAWTVFHLFWQSFKHTQTHTSVSFRRIQISVTSYSIGELFIYILFGHLNKNDDVLRGGIFSSIHTQKHMNISAHLRNIKTLCYLLKWFSYVWFR